MKTDDPLDVYLSGHVAEQIVFDDVSTGAEKKLEQATALTRQMAARCGISAKLGVANFACDDPGGPWLYAVGRTERHGGATVRIIDKEVRLLLDEARQRVTQTLRHKRVLLDRIAAFVLEREVLDHADLASPIEGGNASYCK